MILNLLPFQAGGQCTLSLEPADGWLCTTWSGYVTPADAQRGALDYLEQVRSFPSPYLLNDNTSIEGPWFSSLQWLERSWLPQAIHLGLRYIAHVVQQDIQNDILTLICSVPTPDVFELQLFDDKASAQEWLQECQNR